jgi:hypothetical protein
MREKSLLGVNRERNSHHWIHSMVPAHPGWLAVFRSEPSQPLDDLEKVDVWTEPVAFWALVEFPCDTARNGATIGQELVGVTSGHPGDGTTLDVNWSETHDQLLGYIYIDEFNSTEENAKNKDFWEREAKSAHDLKRVIQQSRTQFVPPPPQYRQPIHNPASHPNIPEEECSECQALEEAHEIAEEEALREHTDDNRDEN